MHHVVLPGLAASTKYFYRCGGPQTGFSSEFSFTSPPTSAQRSFSVMVYGDMGIDNSQNNTRQIIAHKVSGRLGAAPCSAEHV